MKDISLRTKDGWVKCPNKQKHHCDIDGAKLFRAPHGGVYCDRVHTVVSAEDLISNTVCK